MRFSITVPRRITEQLKQAKSTLGRQRRDLTHALGVKLLSLSQQAYRVKSRGGAGSDGITWKPLAASTLAKKGRRGKRNDKRKKTKGGKVRPTAKGVIGIDTGLQLASASPGHANNLFRNDRSSVTVGYNRTYSKYFDAVRPLLPETLPQSWRSQMAAMILRWAQKIIQAAIKNQGPPEPPTGDE